MMLLFRVKSAGTALFATDIAFHLISLVIYENIEISVS